MGDLSTARKPADGTEMELLARKWRLLEEGWDRLRPDALLPGGKDFFAGRRFLEGRPGRRRPLPMVALNLLDARSGRPLFPPSRSGSAGAWEVEFTGIWSEGVLSPHALSAMGLSLTPPGDALASFLSSPSAKGRIVVALSLLPEGELRTLAREAPRPVLFVAPGPDRSRTAAVIAEGRSAVVLLPPGGRHLAEIVLSPPAAGGLPSSYVDASLPARILPLRREAEGKIRTLPPERSAPWVKALAEYDRCLAERAGGWTVSVRLTPLSADIPSDPGLSSRVERYRAEAARIASRPRGGNPPSPRLGSEGCGKCHPDRLSAWKKDRHARALASLARSGDGRNPDCVRCHAPGGGAAGTLRDRLPGGEGVGCEACHGAGVGHPPGRLAVPGEERCLECHGLSPSFRFPDKAPLLSCYRKKERP